MRHHTRTRAIPAVAAAITAVVLPAAACGTVRPSAPPAGQPGGGIGVPRAGTRAQAIALARRMLEDLVLPSGVAIRFVRRPPPALRRPPEELGSGHLVNRHEILKLPVRARELAGFLRRHVPPGMTRTGSGRSGGGSQPVLTFLTDSWRRLPAGLYEADLVTSVLAARGGMSLLRSDAEVIWYPPRTNAEYVNPSRFRAVTVSMTALNPKPQTVRRTFTSPAIITLLARSLNSLHADPGLAFGCPAIIATYRISFLPATARQGRIVAAPSMCQVVAMTVAGRPQPDLLGSQRPIGLIKGLLKVKPALTRRLITGPRTAGDGSPRREIGAGLLALPGRAGYRCVLDA